ncbi:hypothetical protein CAPTEDRAFT_104642 [Capitella teleta]|uniref:AN1-type domain-containing protein n=1 Tax=Capitella teleta TaxID=283909 RepID=R7US69_CAPTE|nr:hypothetical protein CAPTEDRAFT_104642 [Capitella teleta]|eukprot:ELU06762.1 hypothetical protein CAPTEDRAFT_104642 [Capitella teleta]
MAELDIGAHCTAPHCHQLDFLPIKCFLCEQIFCKIHAAYENHKCPKFDNTIVDPGKSLAITYTCHFKACKQREQTQVICPMCNRTFCLQHRHAQDHECPMLEAPKERMPNTRDHIQKILTEKPTRKQKMLSKKACITAAKVQLMKIKMKAVGKKGIPEAEQFFLAVKLPKRCKERESALCFSAKWPIGRAVDHAAGAVRIENKNNVSGAEKLCLFDSKNGRPLPVGEKLDALADHPDFFLLSGSVVILEYVESITESSVDPDDYK